MAKGIVLTAYPHELTLIGYNILYLLVKVRLGVQVGLGQPSAGQAISQVARYIKGRDPSGPDVTSPPCRPLTTLSSFYKITERIKDLNDPDGVEEWLRDLAVALEWALAERLDVYVGVLAPITLIRKRLLACKCR